MTTKDKKAVRSRKAPRSRTAAGASKPARRSGRSAVRPERANPVRAARPERAKPVRAARPVRRSNRRNVESQVVYTPPKPFNKLKLLLGLVTAAAIVLALTLGMSIFFKVENILVSGTQKYTAWDVRDASGVREGDNLLTLGKSKVGGKIIAQLPYVESVRIGIKLPDTVNIEITELDILYAIQGSDNSWWIINAQGRVLDRTTGIVAENYTQILGIRIQDPVVGEFALAVAEESMDIPATEASSDVTTPDGETEPAPTAPVETVDASEQLKLALTIIAHLEENGIIGEVTNVDVGNLYNIQILYDKRYEVLLGDSSQLSYKIRSMEQAVQQMSDYQQGILDVSFTTWPDSVGYTPFEN